MTAQNQAQPKLHLWTVDDYHLMVEYGILSEDSRVELLNGQIVEMSPIGTFHASCVKCINKIIQSLVPDELIIGIQDPIILNDFSEPEPDLTILRPRANFYADAHPRTEDILLLIEVADSSIRVDKETKIPLYARSGISECWLLNTTTKTLEQYRMPGSDNYQYKKLFSEIDTITLLDQYPILVGEMFPFS